MRELCFVAMPTGGETGEAERDEARALRERIVAAITAANLEPYVDPVPLERGPALERLMLCRYAVVGVTHASSDVRYALGIRDAARPGTTLLIEGDVSSDAVRERLVAMQGEAGKAPVILAVDANTFPEIARLKTDVFRERVQYAESAKGDLARARGNGLDAVRAVERALPPLEQVESAVLVDLLLSYRAVKGWSEMIALVERLPNPLAATTLVREQFAFALNRGGEDERAEAVLRDLLSLRGPSSETFGLLGRIYKDRWERTRDAAVLDWAIDAYRRGFEADWRDAYPGINAVTLMELREPPEPARMELLPVVRYAVNRRIATGDPDYWDHATLLELAILAGDRDSAPRHLADARALMREAWEGQSTARNVRLIAETRAARGEDVAWIDALVRELG